MDKPAELVSEGVEVVPVVVLSQTFPARPSSIPDIRDFVRRCLAQSPLSEEDNREVGETVAQALLDAAGPTGAINVSFRIFPDHVEVDVLRSGAQIGTPAGLDALTSLLRAQDRPAANRGGPAASSRAWATVSPTSRLSSSDSGDWARQRRTKSRMSGMDDGRAGNVCDSTTTGTTSMLSLTTSAGLSIATLRSRITRNRPAAAVTGVCNEGTWKSAPSTRRNGRQLCPPRDCSVL